LPEWLIERGIGETRAVLADNGEIVEARIELDGVTPAGSVVAARLANVGTNGRNAVAVAEDGSEFLLRRGAGRVTQGATLTIEVTREAIPGLEPWKRPLARVTDKDNTSVQPLADRLSASELPFPSPEDPLHEFGWDDLLDQARSGLIQFAGGELRVSATPAMTLIDVDGYLAPDELAVLGASAATDTIRRLDIGGSIGIDLPTAGSKTARQQAAAAIDAKLPQPFERTSVNGFGFVQIIRPRTRPSLVELAQDRPGFEARALLRRVPREGPGPKKIVAHLGVIAVLERKPQWIEALEQQVGGKVELRADATLTMSGGYATGL
jgi:ribonuclease G